MSNFTLTTRKLTFHTVQKELCEIQKLVRKKQDHTINLDLQKVEECDSAGLSLLVEAKRQSIKNKKTLKIINISTKIHSLAEFYGVIWVFD